MVSFSHIRLDGLGERVLCAAGSVNECGTRITTRGLEVLGPSVAVRFSARHIAGRGVSDVLKGFSILLRNKSNPSRELVIGRFTISGRYPVIRISTRCTCKCIFAVVGGRSPYLGYTFPSLPTDHGKPIPI